jgi:hypothetical protein
METRTGYIYEEILSSENKQVLKKLKSRYLIVAAFFILNNKFES